MDDINSLMKKSKKDLEQYTSAQDAVIIKLQKENELLKQKLSHLENLLIAKTNTISPEELICIEQIDVIKQKSSQRELSLDEVKRLDILIKNLRLIKDQSTQAIEHKDYREVKEMDLVAIVRNTSEEDN